MPRNTIPRIECICYGCDRIFKKTKKEFNKGERLGYHHYCSIPCISIGQKKDPRRRGYIMSRTNEYSKFRSHLRSIRRRDKHHNITLEYLKEVWDKQDGICPISGIKMDMPINTTVDARTKLTAYTASVDRINGEYGYTQGNIRFVTFMANMCRNKFTDKEVIEFCKRVVENS